jgi:hypothetical protein
MVDSWKKPPSQIQVLGLALVEVGQQHLFCCDYTQGFDF